ncbi:hypothetical protein T06_2560 [Trichinella sp. T6]|nr:hypothetical protein T06_2560 [Trichinella sp. T6]
MNNVITIKVHDTKIFGPKKDRWVLKKMHNLR